MSTTITTIYDAFVTQMATLFPSKYRLSDPLVIENNDEAALANGYGLHFSTATNSLRLVGCQYSVEREVLITLTNQFYGTHKSTTQLDTTYKTLFEDLHILINDFTKNATISGVTTKRDYISDNGVERIFGDTKTFLMIQAIFRIEYFETLT